MALSKEANRERMKKARAEGKYRNNPKIILKAVQEFRKRNPDSQVLEKNVVAWDGEGDSSGYTLLQNSDGLKLEGSPLTIHEVLPYLCRQQTNGKRNLNVWFSSRYDWESLFRFEPKPLLTDLFKKESKVVVDDYLLSIVPRKWLKIWHNGEAFYHWDIYPWFQKSFLKTLDDWRVPYPDIIRQGKELRDQFPDDFPQAEYNLAECVAAKALMEKLMEAVKLTDYNLSSWYGPGALASKILHQCGADTAKACAFPWEQWDEDSPTIEQANRKAKRETGHDLVSLIFKNGSLPGHPVRADYKRCMAYFGGRIELLQRGVFDKVYNYDLTSAYPTATTQLPALDSATWRTFGKITERDLEDYAQGLVEVSWKGKTLDALGPFPFRTDGTDIADNYVIFPTRVWGGQGRFHGIYHLVEVQEAIRKNLWDIKLGSASVIEECWSFPFERVGELLDYRAALKADKDNPRHAANVPLKLGMNSIYGKTAQRPKGTTTYDPPYRELFYAGFITAWTRAQLLKYVEPEAAILLCTDGIYSTEPLDCPISETWGGWEVEVGPMRALLAGVYEFNGSNKSRGFPKLDFNKAFDYITKKNKPYPVKDRRFVSIKQSLAQNKRYPHCGFYDTTKRIDWDQNEKRWLWTGSRSLPNRTDQLTSAPYSWRDMEELENERDTAPEDTYHA